MVQIANAYLLDKASTAAVTARPVERRHAAKKRPPAKATNGTQDKSKSFNDIACSGGRRCRLPSPRL
jgi:hypothetical protein